MKVILRLMILFLLISCHKKTEEDFPENETQEELNKRITEGKPFFDFDEVVHYQISVEEEEFYNLLKSDTISKKTKLLSSFLEDASPTTKNAINEFVEVIDLDPRVEKFDINSKFVEELKAKIFTEKKCKEIFMASCAPLYRDIFALKKNGEVIGLAKICFKCRLYSFSDGDFITDCFTMNGEFKRLKEIITENKKLQ